MMPNAPGEVDFLSWATVAARLRNRPLDEQDAILEELGWDGASWRGANELWARRITDDIAAQRLERPQRFAQLCREEMSVRRALDRVAATRSRGVGGGTGTLDSSAGRRPSAHPVPRSPSPPLPSRHAPPSDGQITLTSEGSVPPPAAPADQGADFRDELTGRRAPKRPHAGQRMTEADAMVERAADVVAQIDLGRSWSVEQYAALCAALASTPTRAEREWASRGIVQEAARNQIDLEWRRRFNAHPELEARWLSLIEQAQRHG